MNRRTRTIIRHEYGATLHRRAYQVTLALVPLLAVLSVIVLGVVQSIGDSSDDGEQVGYVDHSGLLDGVLEVEDTQFLPFTDRDAAVEALRAEETEAVVEIPADYLATGGLVQISPGQGGIPGLGGDTNIQPLLVDALLADNATPAVAERILVPTTSMQQLALNEDGGVTEIVFDEVRLLFFMVVAGIIFFASMLTAPYFQEGLSEEKENRIMEVLLSTATPRELMAGKLGALMAIAMTQLAVWALAIIGVLGFVRATGVVELPVLLAELSFPDPGLLVVALLLFLLGYALIAAMMGILGAVTTSHREAQQAIFLVLLPYILPLWLMQAILSDPDGTLARVMTMVPFTAPITALVRVGLDAISWVELALSTGLLALTVVVIVFLAIRTFEVSLLMYGQRPKASRILRALFEGAG